MLDTEPRPHYQQNTDANTINIKLRINKEKKMQYSKNKIKYMVSLMETNKILISYAYHATV
jgi:hypothetical protein